MRKRLVRASASRSVGSAAATAARSSLRSGSPPPLPCSRGSSRARPSRRTAASRRTSSAFRPRPARCARCGSACRPETGASAGARSTGARGRRCRPLPAGEPTAVALVRESTVGGRSSGSRPSTGSRRTCCSGPVACPRTCTAERCEVLRLRGAGALPERSGAARRPGRHGDPALAPAVRRLPRADRQRARRRGARARRCATPRSTTGRRLRRSSSRRASTGSSRRRCWPVRTARTPGSRRSVPGRRGSGRSTISSTGRIAARTALEAAVAVLVADRAGAGASRGGARRDRRGPPAPARRRRGRCAPRRVRRPRRRRSAARSRGRAPPAHVARCPSLAGRAPHGDGVRRRRLRRRARRLGRRRRGRRHRRRGVGRARR